LIRAFIISVAELSTNHLLIPIPTIEKEDKLENENLELHAAQL